MKCERTVRSKILGTVALGAFILTLGLRPHRSIGEIALRSSMESTSTSDMGPGLPETTLGQDVVQFVKYVSIPIHNPNPGKVTEEQRYWSNFGKAIADVGDINNDGMPDFAIGAPRQSVGGSVFVFSGADRRLLLTINSLTGEPWSGFGYSLAGIGDINEDDVPDLLVGAPGDYLIVGRAYVISGADGNVIHYLYNPEPVIGARFGWAVAGIPDRDGDGISELAVGAPGGENYCPPEPSGKVYIFSGSSGRFLHTIAQPESRLCTDFGVTVADVGDINGDGMTDLLVGDPASGRWGQAHLFSGADWSLLHTFNMPDPPGLPDPVLNGFGIGIASAGDVNRDGVPDILIGHHDVIGIAGRGGAVCLFSGADKSLLHILENPYPDYQGYGGNLGNAVAGIGDITGDGIPDLLASAHLQYVRGVDDVGQVLLYSGADGTLVETIDHPEPQASATFGWGVAAVRDFNSDGALDFVIGAPTQDDGEFVDTGRAYLFLSQVAVLATGGRHTCALTPESGVKCWGANSDGQLGNGTTTDRSTPGYISGLRFTAAAVAAGESHTCALTTGGGVRCWGDNGYGQLGDGTMTDRTTPVKVPGLISGTAAVAAGAYHTCALSANSGVKCWGANEYGQLGDGTTTQRSTPVNVDGLTSGVLAIAAGDYHTCALTASGGVKCWGSNDHGQLGDGTTTDRSTPVDVPGMSGVKAITAGKAHTCALTTGSGVKCWGANEHGQLGNGTTIDSSTPVDVSGLESGVAAITAGAYHTCALTKRGGVRCWGANEDGQLGNGITTGSTVPVDVSGLRNGMAAVAAGGGHTCARTKGGAIKCWGNNGNGQLGDGTTTDRTVPVDVKWSESFTLGVSGPQRASPGETVNYAIAYSNQTTQTVQNAVVVLALPVSSEFVDAIGGGIFWPERHQVFWRLGNLPPGSSGIVSARVRYLWGLPMDLQDSALAIVGGTSGIVTPFDIQPYLTYTPTRVTSSVALSDAEVMAERQGYPDFGGIYNEAVSWGMTFARAERQTLSNGSTITQALFIQPEQGAVMFLRRKGVQVMASYLYGATYAIRDATGGITVSLEPFAANYWGAWMTNRAHSRCIFNCVTEKALWGVMENTSRKVGSILIGADCTRCSMGDADACSRCYASLMGISLPGEATGILQCGTDCSDPAAHICQHDLVTCNRDWFWYSATPQESECVWRCQADGQYYPENHSCPPGERCVEGAGCTTFWPEHVFSLQETMITAAHDPNAKYGPAGDLLPGQLVTYTITCENEGKGQAYGVYILDKLDEYFDDTTLVVTGTSQYFQYIPGTRTLFWDIGDLQPKGQPGSTGVVTFSARLRPDVPGGSAVINQAVVYFPSVPEETPTNPVVNVVQPVIALPQTVRTGAMQPVTITLEGRDVGGMPLTYSIVDSPLNGELFGVAPTLIYSPAVNFTGLDLFTFKVSNGITESRPAEIAILVEPSAADTIPPEVVWTQPVSGAVNITPLASPIFTDTLGPVYGPYITIQFSEALSDTTVTTRTVQLLAGGTRVSATVAYAGPYHRVTLLPRQPLRRGTIYTIHVSRDVRDASGNRMAADFAGVFRTIPFRLYLPLVLRD